MTVTVFTVLWFLCNDYRSTVSITNSYATNEAMDKGPNFRSISYVSWLSISLREHYSHVRERYEKHIRLNEGINKSGFV